jgi:hypothetical protein
MVAGSAGRHPASHDPKGYYALLGVTPDASASDITAAFRRLARVLHPDIPHTGNAERFMAVRQAYDLLSDPRQRASYDLVTDYIRLDRDDTGHQTVPFPPAMVEPPMRRPRLSDVPVLAWIILGLIVVVSGYQVFDHLTTSGSAPPMVRPRTPAVPATIGDREAAIPRPSRPSRLAGTPNHYATPGTGPITIWRVEGETNRLIPFGQLQPFTPVQALRLFRQAGMIEIKVTDATVGLVAAARLMPGNEVAAQRAFCIFHAGPAPQNAEMIDLKVQGNQALVVQNREASPAVVKLRDRGGQLVASFFVGPGEEAHVSGLPIGDFRTDFAFGEVWSKPCGGFAVGMRAWRMPEYRAVAALTPLTIPPDPTGPNQPVELSDLAFSTD